MLRSEYVSAGADLCLVRVSTEHRSRPRSVSLELVSGGSVVEAFEPLPDPPGGVGGGAGWRGGFPVPAALLFAGSAGLRLAVDGTRIDVDEPVPARVAARLASLEEGVATARADSRATLLQLDRERRRARETERELRDSLKAASGLAETRAAAVGRPVYGAALSLCYAIGRAAPFLLLGLFAGTVGVWLARMGRFRRIAEVVSGIALIVHLLNGCSTRVQRRYNDSARWV